ncbi:MAG: energy transducer TonB [Bacteroidia bacterium]|nr:energy transducer TonB [Bacteroidia bacterium]
MKNTFLLLLTIWSSILIGQETQTITVVNENPYYKEVYSVLKSDKSVKHGSYQKFGFNDAIITKGYFKNGLKDSLWKEFQFQAGIRNLQSMGVYISGKKTGVWEFCDINGVTEIKYDFTKKEVVYAPSSKQEVNIIKGKDTIRAKLDRVPVHLARLENAIAVDTIDLKYPRQALENGITGKVHVGITIDKNGKATNYRIIKGLGGGCNEEALSYVKKLPNHWAPGILKGQPVDSEYTLLVSFKIQ